MLFSWLFPHFVADCDVDNGYVMMVIVLYFSCPVFRFMETWLDIVRHLDIAGRPFVYSFNFKLVRHQRGSVSFFLLARMNFYLLTKNFNTRIYTTQKFR